MAAAVALASPRQRSVAHVTTVAGWLYLQRDARRPHCLHGAAGRRDGMDAIARGAPLPKPSHRLPSCRSIDPTMPRAA